MIVDTNLLMCSFLRICHYQLLYFLIVSFYKVNNKLIPVRIYFEWRIYCNTSLRFVRTTTLDHTYSHHTWRRSTSNWIAEATEPERAERIQLYLNCGICCWLLPPFCGKADTLGHLTCFYYLYSNILLEYGISLHNVMPDR